MKKFIIIVILFHNLLIFSQLKDTLNGKVRYIKDKIVFLDKTKQIPKFLKYDGDYGHATIMFPLPLWRRAKTKWYNSLSIGYINCKKEYNKKGFPIKETWYTKKRKKEREFFYVYDKNNNLIQFKTWYHGNDYSIRNYTYNNKNKPKSYLRYSTSDANSYNYSNFIYDKNFNLIKLKDFDEDGEWFLSQEYIYDDKNRKTKSFTYNSSSKLYAINEQMIYDGERVIIKKFKEIFCKKDSLLMEIDYVIKKEYNKFKLIIRETRLDSKGDPSSIVDYSYNKNNSLSMINSKNIIYPQYNSSIEYKYNDNKDIINVEIIEKGKSINLKFDYEYDRNQNWVKQTKIVNGVRLYKWRREIKYYN